MTFGILMSQIGLRTAFKWRALGGSLIATNTLTLFRIRSLVIPNEVQVIAKKLEMERWLFAKKYHSDLMKRNTHEI